MLKIIKNKKGSKLNADADGTIGDEKSDEMAMVMIMD